MVNVQDKQFGRYGNRFFQLAFIWGQFREGKIPDIYLQDYRYFDKYREELRQLFKQEGEPLDYVSIHIRRGKNPDNPDEPAYSDNNFYVDLIKTDYYKKAIEQFRGEKFMIFSDDDDILWNMSDLLPETEYEISYSSELGDFNKMARCKSHIIANSSYSYWCAYLSGNKTIAPSVENWYTSGKELTICPSEWIRI